MKSNPPRVITILRTGDPVASVIETRGQFADLIAETVGDLWTGDWASVDVRTDAEWTFVGLPDLSSLGRSALCVEWQSFPSMAIDGDFTKRTAEELRRAGAGNDTAVLFLCRSGARSRAAAIAMTRAGFTRAYNVAGGFEGDMDPDGHRGHRNGWKASDLPWRQR